MFAKLRYRTYFMRGARMLRAERWEDAAAAFRGAVVADPGDSWARNNLAISLLKLERFEEAAGAFQYANLMNPEFPESWENRGAALMQLERWEEAALVYQRALALAPERNASRTNLAVALFRLERWEEVERALEGVTAEHPDAPMLLTVRAAALANLDRGEESIEALHAAIAVNPEESGLRAGLARTLVKLERWEEAEPALRAALDAGSDELDLHIQLVQALLKLERWEEAQAALDEALARNPDAPELHAARASSLVHLERWGEAAEALQRAVAVSPDSAELHQSLANALANDGRWEEAVEALQRAVALDPGPAAIHASLAAAFVNLERWPEAAMAFQGAIEREPTNPVHFKGLGAALFQAEVWDGAASAYRHALMLDPDDQEATVNLATVLTRVGASEEALAGHRQLVEASPENAAAHLGLGVELLKLERWEEALEALQRATQLAPDSPSGPFLQVDPLLRLGRPDEAAAAWHRAAAPGTELPPLPGEPAALRYDQRRAAFWLPGNLGAKVFQAERWLQSLALPEAESAQSGEAGTRRGRLLFVLDNDYGELTTLMYMVLGRELSREVSLLLPERLIASNAEALPGRTAAYRSVEDVLRVVDLEEPELVFLCSGYLFSIHELFGLEELERLTRALEQRGCRVITSDPFLGMFSREDPAQLVSIHIPEESHDLDVAALQQVKAVEDERLRNDFRACERIFRAAPHLYPACAELPASEASPFDERNFSFFNPELVHPEPDPREATDPHWLFILSRTDYETQMMFEGVRFIDIVVSKLVEARAAGRHPILVAPDELVQSVISRMPTVDGIDILSFCPFNQLMSLLLTAEQVFYWNVVSHSILLRLFNGLPVILFDRGHLVRNVPAMYERVVRWYYQGWQASFRDHHEPLTLDTVAAWNREFEEGRSTMGAGFRRLPTPEQMVEKLGSSGPSRAG